MRRLLLVVVTAAAALAALAAPASAQAKCIYLPDTDGHVWEFCPHVG